MQLKQALLLAGVALILCGFAMPSRGGPTPQHLGPCDKGTVAFLKVPKCEPTCTFVCFDPCRKILVKDGACLNQTGPCSEFSQVASVKMCRNCDCPLGGGNCNNLGLYVEGTQNYIQCVR